MTEPRVAGAWRALVMAAGALAALSCRPEPGAAPAPGSAGRSKLIRAADFLSVAARTEFFEERINSLDPEIRRRVLNELGFCHCTPTPEYVRFLRRMMEHPDLVIRGRAINKLYDLWVPVRADELPDQFSGYTDKQIVDRWDPKCLKELVKQTQGGGAGGGWAAYVLGLLRYREGVPALKKLGSDSNIFARYTAGRALLQCGEKAAAREILRGIIDSQLELYAAGRPEPPRVLRPSGHAPHYAMVACRAYMHLGPDERRFGLESLAALMGHLEKSSEVNDRSQLHWLRGMLAAVTGRFVASSADFRAWLKEEYPPPGKEAAGN